MDIVMPEMDGLEACRAIKSQEIEGFLPILMLTSMDKPEDVVKGLDAGADDYISKNAHDQELLARVRANLTVKHYHDELLKAQRKLEMAAELFASIQTAAQLHDLVGRHLNKIHKYAETDIGPESIIAEVDSIWKLIDQILDQLSASYDKYIASPSDYIYTEDDGKTF